MDFVTLLHVLEDAVYEILVWILLLPKTLFQILFRPDWIHRYVTTEWDKEPEKRFTDYLSPVLFWLLIAVLPVSFGIASPAKEGEARGISGAFVESNLASTVFVMLVYPLIYLVWMQRLRREPIEKISLKRLFYIQCYCLTPSMTVLVLRNYFLVNTPYFDVFWYLVLGILIFYEGFVFRAELKIRTAKAFLLASVPPIILMVLAAIILELTPL